MNGVFLIVPNAKGLPGLSASLQKLIFPKSEKKFPISSILLFDIPPEVIIRSNLLRFFRINFLVSFKLSFIIPRSSASQPIFLINAKRTVLLASYIEY